MSWPVAGLLLAACAVSGVCIGLVRGRTARRLLLVLAVAVALVLFVPVRCAPAQEQVGADPGQFGGQASCSTALGARLPEVASLDGDGPGYALALGGAALVLAGSWLVGRRRRVPVAD